MGRRLNMVVLATMAIAAMLQSSAAQTAYVVGDALGWVVPPGGASVYTTWAANKTFRVGDTLVFNFANGAHDVVKVNRANFDACNATNPFFTLPNGPANVTLNETGDHYFLCGIPGHCGAGQKLAVNVSAAASSPAPQPSSPAPQPSPASQPSSPPPAPTPQPASPPPAPTPQPSAPAPTPQAGSPPPISAPTPAPTRSPMTYTVGENLGWTVPSGGASTYQAWANGKNFMVGDILVFNYATGVHDVFEVSREAYESCSSSNPIANYTTGPTRITLQTPGEHLYICTISGHCAAGQKLATNVTSSSTETPPPTGDNVTPPPTGDNVTPPPGNSATSLGVAGLSATFLPFIVAFFM